MPSSEFLTRPGSIWEQYTSYDKPPEIVRVEMETQLLSNYVPPDGVRWELGECGGIKGKWVFPKEKPDQVLLYFHGGGFTLGSSGIPIPFLCELSRRLNLACFSADYRLAPENPFPAGVNDCVSAYEGLLSVGYQSEQIALGGESAGGTFCISLIHQLKATGRPLPKAVVAMSPAVDSSSDQSDAKGDGAVLEALPGIEEIIRVYAPDEDLKNPLISPIYGDFSGFPPLFVIAGGAEALCNDSLSLAAVCAKTGGDLKLLIGRDMIHTYPLDFRDYPEASKAMDEIELFLKQKLIQNL